MDESKEIVERLRGLELVGGSHQMLAAIGAAVLPTHHGWTSGACRALRDRLVELVEDDAYGRGYAAGYATGADTTEADMGVMIERQYIPLPLDADGVPVRISDVMEWPDGSTFTVVGIGDGTLFYVEGEGDRLANWTGASTKFHHKPDSWERIIEDALSNGSCYSEFDVGRLVERCQRLALATAKES